MLESDESVNSYAAVLIVLPLVQSFGHVNEVVALLKEDDPTPKKSVPLLNLTLN